MRLTRSLAVLSLVLSLGLLASCSGDDDDDDPGQGESTTSAAESPDAPSSEEAEEGSNVVKDCKSATVAVTGAVTAEWEGEAEVRLSKGEGPKAVYRISDEDRMITAYSEGKGFSPSVNFVDGDTTFATAPGDPAGLDIGTKGKAAAVDADAFDLDEKSVHLAVSFDC